MHKALILLTLLTADFTTSVLAKLADTPSITRGRAVTTATNLFPGCAGSRVTALGSIKATDNTQWTVPAETRFTTAPRLTDLYNQCSGVTPANLNAVDLDAVPVDVIDSMGVVITGFLFGDNYSEIYVNDKLLGVDPVPYTPFNSTVVRFKVKRPYTIAVKLVDWEENMGLGTENNNGNLYHPGDGGFIAQFSDGTVTNTTWKAQTFYIAPLESTTSVVTLSDGTRSSASASVKPGCADSCYAVHYPLPASWSSPSFDDSGWPRASVYTAQTVGVNFPAFMNFTNAWSNAQFIWSSNLILDNVVCLRTTVRDATGVEDTSSQVNIEPVLRVTSTGDALQCVSSHDLRRATINVVDMLGDILMHAQDVTVVAHVPFQLAASLPRGVFLVHVNDGRTVVTAKLVVE